MSLSPGDVVTLAPSSTELTVTSVPMQSMVQLTYFSNGEFRFLCVHEEALTLVRAKAKTKVRLTDEQALARIAASEDLLYNIEGFKYKDPNAMIQVYEFGDVELRAGVAEPEAYISYYRKNNPRLKWTRPVSEMLARLKNGEFAACKKA